MVQILKKLVKLDAYRYAYIFVIVILFASYFSDANAQKSSYHNNLSIKEQLPVSRGEMSIKDVLPQEELDYITHNMQVDHTCLYTIALLNPEDKFIQIIPVTIKIKGSTVISVS